MKHIEKNVREAADAVKEAYELTRAVRTALPVPRTGAK